MTFRNTVPLLVAAVLVVSGCGGDDDGDATTGAEQTTTLSAAGVRALTDFNRRPQSDSGPAHGITS